MPCSGSAPSRATGSMSAAPSATPVSAFACCKIPRLPPHGTWRKQDTTFLIGRYRRPEPRNTLALLASQFRARRHRCVGRAGRRCARSSRRSRMSAQSIETARVPFSSAARKALKREPELLAHACSPRATITRSWRRSPRRAPRPSRPRRRRKARLVTHDRPHRGRCRRGERGGSGRQDARAGALGVRPFLAPDQ